MERKEFATKVIATIFVTIINIVQLLQVFSFLKDAPKSGSWDSGVKDMFRDLKKLALRLDDTAFIVLYAISCISCALSFILYLVFSEYIHKVNKNGGLLSYVIYFFEYVIFGLGFIPMLSKFVEVQICNDSLKIDTYTSVKCFKDEQLALLQVGFFCIGIAYLMAAAVFPTLKFERNSVEKLWGNESYAEGFYYLVLLGSVSLLCYIMLPWVGIFLCTLALAYILVLECYENVAIACSRCGVLAALVWGYASAYVIEDSQSHGSNMIYAMPVAYLVGYFLRLVRNMVIKKRHSSKR